MRLGYPGRKYHSIQLTIILEIQTEIFGQMECALKGFADMLNCVHQRPGKMTKIVW